MITTVPGGKLNFKLRNTLNELDLYEGDVSDSKNNSVKQRAVAILECYGGFKNYTEALKANRYDVEILKDDTSQGCSVFSTKDNRPLHYGDIPLQIIPQDSPLGKLKTAISSKGDPSEIKFTSDCTLSPEQINEIKENQKKVIRFAVKRDISCEKVSGTLLRTARGFKDEAVDVLDTKIRQKCFTDKEFPGEVLKKEEDGLMSSYITPLTLYLHQSGSEAGKRVTKETTIYYTGFGYPVFDDKYCQECKKLLNEKSKIPKGNAILYKKIEAEASKRTEKKSQLKAIFKQQIFAVLLAREQQIGCGEINNDTKVPLVLNRAFDFMKTENAENAEALKEFVNLSLCELFQERDVADAMKGKIDQVLIWDPPKKITNSSVKFFGDVAKFQTILQSDQYKDNKGEAIEVVDMMGYDMISVARCYETHKKIKLVIPGMVNPNYQDGEGAMLGIGATEESLNVASLGMMQIYLNSQHNARLAHSKILNASTLDRFKSPQISSEPTSDFGRSESGSNISSKEFSDKKENGEKTPSCFDTLFTKENLAGVGTGIAVAGTTMLCASALGFGIVSLPVVVTAVGIGAFAGGLTYIATKHYAEKAQKEDLRGI